MTDQPLTRHGRLEGAGTDRCLVVERELPVDATEAWAWITDPDRTARWYGPWSGTPGAGSTIQVTMSAEEGAPTSDLRIVECEPGRRCLLASTLPAPYDWHLELSVRERGGGSVVALRHLRLGPEQPVGDIGAGWEFYLDHLACAVVGGQGRPFEDYQAALAHEYAALA